VLQKLFKIDFLEPQAIFGRVDLDHLVSEIKPESTEKSEINSEIQMFKNVLDFNSIKVRECMIPRTEIIAMKIDEPIENLRIKFAETGLSRILIYNDNIDNIIGFVHSYELFKNPRDIQSIIMPVIIVPETMPARTLLTQFINSRKSIALVVDELGGTAGIVTMEDIMEEIFGEIDDEHDVEKLAEIQVNENEYIFSGRLEIDYLNRQYTLNLPEGENYETLGGLILYHYRHIPEVNEEILLHPFLFTIIKVNGNRIEEVKVRINHNTE